MLLLQLPYDIHLKKEKLFYDYYEVKHFRQHPKQVGKHHITWIMMASMAAGYGMRVREFKRKKIKFKIYNLLTFPLLLLSLFPISLHVGLWCHMEIMKKGPSEEHIRIWHGKDNGFFTQSFFFCVKITFNVTTKKERNNNNVTKTTWEIPPAFCVCCVRCCKNISLLLFYLASLACSAIHIYDDDSSWMEALSQLVCLLL